MKKNLKIFLSSLVICIIIWCIFYFEERMCGIIEIKKIFTNKSYKKVNINELYICQLSLTFITISLISVLSEKGRDIYWINLVESRLIEPTYTCFYAYTIYSFIALAFGTISYLIGNKILFLIYFIIGIVSLTFLTLKTIGIYYGRNEKKDKLKDIFCKKIQKELKQYTEVARKMKINTIRAYNDKDYYIFDENCKMYAETVEYWQLEDISYLFNLFNEDIANNIFEIIEKSMLVEYKYFKLCCYKYSDFKLDIKKPWEGIKNYAMNLEIGGEISLSDYKYEMNKCDSFMLLYLFIKNEIVMKNMASIKKYDLWVRFAKCIQYYLINTYNYAVRDCCGNYIENRVLSLDILDNETISEEKNKDISNGIIKFVNEKKETYFAFLMNLMEVENELIKLCCFAIDQENELFFIALEKELKYIPIFREMHDLCDLSRLYHKKIELEKRIDNKYYSCIEEHNMIIYMINSIYKIFGEIEES